MTLTHGRQSPLHIALVLGAIVAATAGCGSGGTGGSDASTDANGDSGATLTAADKAFFTDLCAAVGPCCAKEGVTSNPSGCLQWLAKVAVSRDPQVRMTCLSELRQRATSQVCVPDVVDLGDACSRLIYEPSGPRAPGEPCRSAADCAGSPGTVTLCSDHCVVYKLGAEGDYPCLGVEASEGFIQTTVFKTGGLTTENEGFICQKRAGLFCDWTDNKCKRVQPGGAACPLYDGCDSRNCGDDGICLPLPALGEECTITCAGDNYCDHAVCKPKLAPGMACDNGSSDLCAGDCHGSNLCSGSCSNGVCSPLTAAESGLLQVLCKGAPLPLQ